MRYLLILALSAIATVSAIPVAVPGGDADPTLPIPTEPSVSGLPFSMPTGIGIGSFGFSLPSNPSFGPGANDPTGTDGHFPSFPTGFPSSPQFPREGGLSASESSPFAIPSGLFPSGGFEPFPGAPSGSFESGFPSMGFPTSFPTGLSNGFPSSFPTGLPTGIPNSFPTGLPTGFPGSFSFGGGIPGFPSFPLSSQGLPTESVSEPVPTDASESVPAPTPTVSV